MPANGTKITRRRAVAGLGAALGFPAILEAGAQTAWPSKPVKLIMPYAPGGAGDTVARPWAEKLTQAFGVPFVVDNRGGASGTIGAEAGARATPDGTTFLITPNSALNVVPQLRKVGYDARKDLMPVARVGDIVGGFAIVQSLGIKTMAELISYAKQNPGQIAFGSAGLGTSTQLRIETLKLRAGIDILHVPYRGSGDALVDLLAGSVQMMNEIVVYPHVKAGKLNLAGDQQSNAALGFSRRPDDDGSRLSQRRCADLVFDMGAGRERRRRSSRRSTARSSKSRRRRRWWRGCGRSASCRRSRPRMSWRRSSTATGRPTPR